MTFDQWKETAEGNACMELRDGMCLSDVAKQAYEAGYRYGFCVGGGGAVVEFPPLTDEDCEAVQ